MRTKMSIFCLFLFLVQTGCSIVLPLIMPDNNENQAPFTTIKNAHALKQLRKTSILRLTRTDGEIVEGKYLGFFQYTDGQYRKLYKKFSETPVKTIVPALDDSIWMILKKSKAVQGVFRGFDLFQVCYRDKKGRQKTMDIEKIARLHWKRELLATSGLRSLYLLREPRLPLRSYVALDCDKSPVIVSLNDIETFEKVNQDVSVSGYMLLGLLVDVLAFTMYFAYLMQGLGELE